MSNQNNSTMRDMLAARAFLSLQTILNSDAEISSEAATTVHGHIGSNSMTDDQLFQHCRELAESEELVEHCETRGVRTIIEIAAELNDTVAQIESDDLEDNGVLADRCTQIINDLRVLTLKCLGHKI